MAYRRTECGVWTQFELKDNKSIMSSDLPEQHDTAEWADANIKGIKHGTIVEGSEATFSATAVMFPLTDAELEEVWEYLDAEVDHAEALAEAED